MATTVRDPAGTRSARGALLSASAVVPHVDADGLSAAAIALRARGEGAGHAVLLGRGQTPFDPDAPLPDGLLAILDWGVRDPGRPALIVDHHVPEQAGEESIVVSGHGERPEPTTSVLMRRLVPEAPAWLAAVGAFGDLGRPGLDLPECAGAPRGAIRKLVPLVNAPRRVPDGPVEDALALLVESSDPREALGDRRAAALNDARREWRAAFDMAMRTPPAVSRDVAVIRFSSACQVHPLVATAWARRLAPRMVLAANDGYLPGRVNFAVRGGDGDLRDVLVRALPEHDGELGRGHLRATGGSLAPDEFVRLLHGLDGRG